MAIGVDVNVVGEAGGVILTVMLAPAAVGVEAAKISADNPSLGLVLVVEQVTATFRSSKIHHRNSLEPESRMLKPPSVPLTFGLILSAQCCGESSSSP
ncbi:uncharacterized protein J3R85_019819 [Psidium guajava]|nr:uncharacterized protein J3R85_019819 [Psidium guajava]